MRNKSLHWTVRCAVLMAMSWFAGATWANAETVMPPSEEAAMDGSGSSAMSTMETRAALAPSVHDLPLTTGGLQRVLWQPTRAMRGVIVMFPGGAGNLDIQDDGTIRNDHNFLVRSSVLWQQRGYGVVLVDAMAGRSLRGLRSTPEYAGIAAQIVAFADTVAAHHPVWLMGTSQGSIAAMNAAAHAAPGSVAGVVLTESVSVLGGSHETVFSADPAGVQVPALVVANGQDRCSVAPPAMAPEIVKAMTATHATLLGEDGGEQSSRDDCGSLTPHGYAGIETQVVDDIDRWLRTNER